MVEQLEELLAGPVGGVGEVGVVDDQELGVAGVFEEHGVGHLRIAAIGGAEAVEQIGGDEVEGARGAFEASVGQLGGESRAARAGGPGEDQPALRGQLVGELAGGPQVGVCLQRLIGETLSDERAEVAHALELLGELFGGVALGAFAGHGATEGLVTDGHVAAQVARAATTRAGRRRAGRSPEARPVAVVSAG